jgi:ABC-type multidrug transport system permease subunit
MRRSLRRIWAAFYARNLEFIRDRSTMAWNLVLPVLLVVGLAFLFSGEGQPLFKVAVIAEQQVAPLNEDTVAGERANLYASLHPFLATRFVNYYQSPAADLDTVIGKVGRHQVDMLVDLRAGEMHYWVNDESPKGYFLELILQGSAGPALSKQTAQGEQVRYVDWVVPGILGMNIMFSCLFGVGFVIVRYRKNGYLKRLKATPLTATEFLLSQVLSRLILVVLVTSVVFAGTNLLLDFTMEGSYLSLFLVLVAGTFSLISLGLVVAARVSSEELAGGLLNLLTWPMMLLSGVWFSMEGTHPWLQAVSQLSPLTHMLSAARAIMLDGAGLVAVMDHLLILLGTSVVFLALGAYGFKWSSD